MALGENIRQLRIGRGWSTHRLAEEISLRLGRELFQSSISRYESNEIRPRAGVLRAMADALGVELVQLEYGDQRLLTVSVGIHKVPLIDWADVQEFLNAPRQGLEVMHPFLLTHEEYSAKALAITCLANQLLLSLIASDKVHESPSEHHYKKSANKNVEHASHPNK